MVTSQASPRLPITKLHLSSFTTKVARHFHCCLLHTCTSAHLPLGSPGLHSSIGLSLVLLFQCLLTYSSDPSLLLHFFLYENTSLFSKQSLKHLSYSAPLHSGLSRYPPVFKIIFDFIGFLSLNLTVQMTFQVSSTE